MAAELDEYAEMPPIPFKAAEVVEMQPRWETIARSLADRLAQIEAQPTARFPLPVITKPHGPAEPKVRAVILCEVIYKTLSALVCSAMLSLIVFSFNESRANSDVAGRVQTNQVPGQFLIAAFLLILINFVFGGFFTPEPQDEWQGMDYSEPWK